MARAARQSGTDPDDEDYEEFEEMLEQAEGAQVRKINTHVHQVVFDCIINKYSLLDYCLHCWLNINILYIIPV